MISSDELASTGSSPGIPISTSTSSSSTASLMIWARRACRPTEEPTATVLLGIRFSLRCHEGGVGALGRGAADGLEDDHRDRADEGAGDQRDEVARDVVHGEEDEDAAVRGA